MKITMGMTTWTEHPVLIHDEQRPVRLDEYAQHFPVVEVDTFSTLYLRYQQFKTGLLLFPQLFSLSLKLTRK